MTVEHAVLVEARSATLSLDVCVRRYLDKLNRSGRPDNTIRSYSTDLSQFCNLFPDLKVGEVMPAHFAKFIKQDEIRGLAHSSKGRKLAAIRGFFKDCVKNGILSANPCDVFKAPKPERYAKKTLTDREVRLLVEDPDRSTIKGLRDRALICLLLETGAKTSETCGLNIGDINFESNRVIFKDRQVSFSILTKERLVNYLERRNLDDTGAPMFVNFMGGRLTRQGVFLILREYAKRTGNTANISVETIRLTCVKSLLEKGASNSDIQRLLGHKNPNTTVLMERRVSENNN